MPQVTMMRAIQIRAPTFSRIRLLGISNRKITEEENSGAPAIDCRALKPKSLFMVSAAMEMLLRSI